MVIGFCSRGTIGKLYVYGVLKVARKASMISGIETQYVAMLAKMLSLYCGATLLESYFKEASNFIQIS